jgi:hypothetical protein
VRAYYATEFSESRAKRGPNFFFVADDGHLRELRRPDEVRDLAVGIVYADRLDAGRDALRHLLRKNSKDRDTRYWLAWVELARGDRTEAERHLGVLGHQVVQTDSVFLTEAPPRDATYSNWKDWLAWRRSPYKAFQDVDKLLAAGDTTGATGVLERAVEVHAMMAEVHAHRADLALLLRDYQTAAVEAFATRSLAPEAPRAWRRWASVMLLAERPEQARLALERYFELAPERRDRDREATRLLEKLRRVAGGAAVAVEAGRKPGTSSQEL